jgi:hypothetical protein
MHLTVEFSPTEKDLARGRHLVFHLLMCIPTCPCQVAWREKPKGTKVGGWVGGGIPGSPATKHSCCHVWGCVCGSEGVLE